MTEFTKAVQTTEYARGYDDGRSNSDPREPLTWVYKLGYSNGRIAAIAASIIGDRRASE